MRPDGQKPEIVYVIDDDAALRRTVARLLQRQGYTVECYGSGLVFLNDIEAKQPGCILLDIRMPAVSGLKLQEALVSQGVTWPLVILSGHGDITAAVTAMKAGACDFVQKPYQGKALVAAIKAAFLKWEQQGSGTSEIGRSAELLAKLSKRELEVLQALGRGLPNKLTAHELGISIRTVEMHRANLMGKLGVRSLSEALRIAFEAGMLSRDAR